MTNLTNWTEEEMDRLPFEDDAKIYPTKKAKAQDAELDLWGELDPREETNGAAIDEDLRDLFGWE